MRREFRTPVGLRLAPALLVLGLGIVAPASADEDRIILRADLSGSTCPAELVLVEATGCKADDLAEELIRELVAEGFDEKGFDATDCQAVEGGETERICWYSIPAGCRLDKTSITVERGDRCTEAEAITGRDFGEAVGYHFFAFGFGR